MALKYQLFIEGTSLYAQVELDQKISSEMEQIIVGEDVQMIFKLINNVDDYVFGEGDIFVQEEMMIFFAVNSSPRNLEETP